MNRCARTTGASNKRQASSSKQQVAGGPTSDKQQALDKRLRIWDNVITINRKDTYDIKLSKRRIQFTGRCAARSGQTATGERRKAAAHGSEARRKDQRPGNPGERPSRIYPGVQARAGEATGRQRAQQRHHPRAERSHRRPQVPAGDANQLRRRLMDRALRGPSSGYRIKLQATSLKLQAASVLPKHQAPSSKRQAPSRKQQAPGSRCLHKV